MRSEESIHLPKTNTTVLVSAPTHNNSNSSSNVAVIVTHPYGPLGGNLHNNVVVAACLYFSKLGVTTARFNFNGGCFGRGHTQVAQVQDVAEYLCEKQPAASHILLVGYSYGALIAASASAHIPQTLACISIAPPFAVQHWLLCFSARYHLEQASCRTTLPRLFLLGTADNFTSERVFRETVAQYFSANTTTTTTGAVLKGADHFFRRREKDVMDVIGQWLLETFATYLQGDLKNLPHLPAKLGLDDVRVTTSAKNNNGGGVDGGDESK